MLPRVFLRVGVPKVFGAIAHCHMTKKQKKKNFRPPTFKVNIQKHKVVGKSCFHGHFSCFDKFGIANIKKRKNIY